MPFIFGIVDKGGDRGNDDECDSGGGNGMFCSFCCFLTMVLLLPGTDSTVEVRGG